MNDPDPHLFRFDATHLAHIKETRVRIKSELEAASIRVLRFSDNTQTTLNKAGFRTIGHLLYPSPEQIKGVAGIIKATKQEIRDRVAWVYRQARRYFRRQLLAIWRDQLAQQRQNNPTDEPPKPNSTPGEPNLESPSVAAKPDTPLSKPHFFDLDQPIDQLHLFSARVQTALLRSGVLTLRLLILHTPDLLLLYVRHLSERGLQEIRTVLAGLGLTLAVEDNSLPVAMFNMLTDVLHHSTSPCRLATITQLVNGRYALAYTDQNTIAKAARIHPYLREIEPELFQFDFRFGAAQASETVETPSPSVLSTEQVELEIEASTAAASPPPLILLPQPEPSLTKRKTDYLIRSAEAGWTGKPGSRLQTWELKLRQQFEQVAWIGQLALTEDDFYALCQAIREEARGVTTRARKFNGQPKLVPAAAFLTAMVFSARYAEQLSDEAVDEFWAPYLRTVWQVEHSVVFMELCRKRFVAILPYLEQTFGFEFPRFSAGNLVTAIFRHALIPRYMQADFAAWLRKNWRDILAVALSPTLLAAQLQQDRSLDYYSQRLKRFVTGKGTAETAAALIRNMAAAISLHVNDGETIEAISQLLVGTPIEQALWQEIAQDFVSQDEAELAALRWSQPRLTWVWSLDKAELALRVQNIILAAATDWEGEPDRLVWLDAPGKNPEETEIEKEVSPWRMNTGERIIPDVFLRHYRE